MFHGYSSLVHRLAYSRPNHDNMHVYGYMEEGTTTTPFDMTVLNEIDRFHIVQYVLRSLPDKGVANRNIIDQMDKKLLAHREYVNDKGEDMPEIKDWHWQDR
jgi:xylulose-5-phosphate/fructose-6-phosphate phosphoketolase